MKARKPALRPRKSPVQARSTATVDAILEAAARILERHGLAGFTTNAVAVRAGVSIGSLYQYFPGKDALAVALIQREQESLLGNLERAMAGIENLPLEDGVRALVDAAVAGQQQAPRKSAALDHEEARLPIRAALERFEQRQDALLAPFLAKHLPGCPEERLATVARTARLAARAIIDAWSNLAPPRFDLARAEASIAVIGYVEATRQAMTAPRRKH